MLEIGGYNTFKNDREKNITILDEKNVYGFNLARNCLDIYVKSTKPKIVYAPNYTCHSVHEVLSKSDAEIIFYNIDEKFKPIFSFENIEQNSLFIINNYFGICDKQISDYLKIGINPLVDNSQGYFSNISNDIAQIFSPRKFFGLPDGGILRCNNTLEEYQSLPRDVSSDRLLHLFKADEIGKNHIYKDYISYRDKLQKLEPKKISKITEIFMQSIDYNLCRQKRKQNYLKFHNLLGTKNLLSLPDENVAPMFYPLLIEDEGLKDHLVSNNIYIGNYWPKKSGIKDNYFEKTLRKKLCCIPVDQSLNDEHIKYIYESVIKFN